MIKGVAFDLDGVLTHTSEEHFHAWAALAQELGGTLPESVKDAVRGISRMDSLELVLQAIGRDKDFTQAQKKALADHKNDLYREMIARVTPKNLESGALELLIDLKKRGFRLALASASRSGSYLLKKMEIEKYFDAVVDPASVKCGKPDPEIFLKAAELLELSPKECLGVEDAAAGIESIQAAGMKAIGIGSREVQQADWVFENIQSAGEWLMTYLKEQEKWQA